MLAKCLLIALFFCPVMAAADLRIHHVPGEQDGQSILYNYYRKGYLEAKISHRLVRTNETNDQIQTTFYIDQGPLFRLSHLHILGDLPPHATEISLRARISQKDGEPIDLIKLQQEVDALLNDWRDDGYAFAKATPSLRGGTSLDTTYQIRKNMQYHIGNIIVEGANRTKESVILREFTHLKGQLYRHLQVEAAYRALRSLQYFSAAELKLVPMEHVGVLDIVIRVQEKPTWYFSLLPTISVEGFGVAATVGDHNFLGRGLDVAMLGQLTPFDGEFVMSIKEPRLLDHSLAISGDIFHRILRYPGFDVASSGASTSLSWYRTQALRVTTGFSAELVNDTTHDVHFAWRNTLRAELVLGPDTISGTLFASYAGIATGSQLASAMFGWTFSSTLCLASWLSIKARTKMALLANIEGRRLAAADRFFIGGQGSVRGYLPRVITSGPLGGTKLWEHGIEARLSSGRDASFALLLFSDAGNVFDEAIPWFSGGLFWSAGFGAVLKTLDLPVKVEVAFPLRSVPPAYAIPLDIYVGVESDF